MKTTLYDKKGNVLLSIESFLTEKEGLDFLNKDKLPTEADVCGIEKLIGHKYPPQLRSAILKYGYIAKDGDEYLGARNGLSPEKQGLYNDLWDGLYSWGVKLDRVYFPFSANGCGDYLCVDEHDRLYEFIHDSNNHIVEFDKTYKCPDCKDFNSYLKNVILNKNRDYYGKIGNKRGTESLDLTKVKYETGHDAYGANVSKETINFLSKNKDKLKKMFLEAALNYYKESTYGDFAEEEIGKKIKDCTTADMDSLIHGPYKILEDSSIRSYRKSDFVITAENKLDPEHGIAVGFSKSPLKVVETGDIGYFL